MKFVLKAVANNGQARTFQKAEVSSVFAVRGLEARICQDPKDHLVVFDDSIICIYTRFQSGLVEIFSSISSASNFLSLVW